MTARNLATGPEDLRRDLYEAMKQVAETGHGPEDQIPSMGCSIKWKEPPGDSPADEAPADDSLPI